MTKGIIAWMMAAVLLCGCQLAEPETEPQVQGADRLVGVYVTREHLNLFDMEGWLQDNAGKLVHGGETMVEDSGQYSRRIYAALVEEAWTDEEGNTHSSHTYEFPDLEGQLFSTFRIEKGEESYWSNDAGDWFSDIRNHYNHGDNDSTGLELEATIYVSQEMEEILFFYNPVYQTLEGEVYLVEGQGSACQFYEGSSMSHTMSDEKTIDGQRTDWTDIRLTVECIQTAERITVCFMDENHQLLSKEEYEETALPGEINAPEGAAYMICEVYCLDDSMEEVVSRQIQDRESGAVLLYRQVEKGICRKTELKVVWPEEQ